MNRIGAAVEARSTRL